MHQGMWFSRGDCEFIWEELSVGLGGEGWVNWGSGFQGPSWRKPLPLTERSPLPSL